MDAQTLFLVSHARVWPSRSSAGLQLGVHLDADPQARDPGDRIAGFVTRQLSDEELKIRPDGLNSLAWLIWHVSRLADITLNVFLRDSPQLLDRNGWWERLGVDARDMGTGMEGKALDAFDRNINVPELKAYWAAVGEELIEAGKQFSPDGLEERVTTTQMERFIAEGGMPSSAPAWMNDWLTNQFFANRSKGWFASLLIGHTFSHWGEMDVTGNLLRASRAR